MAKSLRNKVLAYAKKQYDTAPDKPWAKYPDNEVLRHGDTRQWYGLIFPVEREKLGVTGSGMVDILNVKCDPDISFQLTMSKKKREKMRPPKEWLVPANPKYYGLF